MMHNLAALIENLKPMRAGKKLIRLGQGGDGGYLVPDDLAGIEACFSPGVGNTSKFEEDSAEYGMKVFMADKSVDFSALSHHEYKFTRKHIGAITSNDCMTMDDWVDSSLPETHSDLLLQMDIEGYEYESILCMSDSLLKRFRVMVIEFHRLGALFNPAFFMVASRAFEKILQTHICVHIHPNNCCGAATKHDLDIPRVMEFTFLRKDRVGSLSPAEIFPHPLDDDNVFDVPSLPLPECWYAGGGIGKT